MMPGETSDLDKRDRPLALSPRWLLLPVVLGLYLAVILAIPEEVRSIVMTPLPIVSLSSLAALGALVLMSVVSGQVMGGRLAIVAGVLFVFSSGMLYLLGS